MLKIILNKLRPKADKIVAEEQAGLRAGRSTTEQVFHLRIRSEKYLQHQQDLYHVFIDFKKAFDRVCHAALWATTSAPTLSESSNTSMKDHKGDWFGTTVGVRQGCLLSPTLFNILLERIMTDAS